MKSEILIDNVKHGISRLFCPMERNNSVLFFSLVDYRNNYFMSDDPSKIIEFYNGFENRNQLIQWMRERPTGVANIHEVEGDKDIIVVIPTADFNGKYAKECRENIFKGLHIIFVESGGKVDFYFNYAHNCNVGIKKAMEYNPKWVVVSNDDIIFAHDNVKSFIIKLGGLDFKRTCAVFPLPSTGYHSVPMCVIRTKFVYHFIQTEFFKSFKIGKKFKELEKKFGLDYAVVPRQLPDKPIRQIIYMLLLLFAKRLSVTYINPMSFTILSKHFIRNNNWFDEIFINDSEDDDLGLRISLNCHIEYISYKFTERRGTTIGNNKCREIRALASRIYFQFKNQQRILGNEKLENHWSR